MKRAFLILAAFSLSLLTMGLAQPLHAAPKVVKVSIVQPDGDPSADAMREEFKKFIEDKTHGRYRVDVYTGGSLGNSDTVFQGVQFGSLHIATESTSNLSQFAPPLSVLDMPYLFPSWASIEKAFAQKAGQDLLATLNKAGVKPLGLIPSTFRVLATNKEIHTLQDIQGLKLRATASKWHIASIKALGMNPTPMAATEMVTGIQQGVVAGADPNITSLISYRFCDVAKYVLLSDHVPVLFVLYTNGAWWDKLPAEDKAIFEQGVKLYHDSTQQRYASESKRVLDTVQQQHGVKVSPLSAEEKAKWAEKAAPVYKELPKEFQEIANAIRKDANK